jgi:kynureninase
MAIDVRALDESAARLRPFYRHFLGGREGEVLLTAHSHQAWPDASLLGQLEAWHDAARLVDRKWERVFGELLPELRAGLAKRLGSSRPADLALAPNTHELVFRLASCFPWDAAVVTTDGEFHSLRRQLRRLAEDGLRLIEVPHADAPGFADRFLDAVERERPAWVALSQVFFGSGRVVTDLPRILAALAERDTPVLVDTYHAFNVLPLDVDRWPGRVFVTGGGYKYAQHGEGVCWMLLPPDAGALRPRHTGWFADFAGLEGDQTALGYAPGGDGFFGSTFDPSGVYRAVHVLRFMDEAGLDVPTLRRASLARTALLIERFDTLELEAHGLRLVTPRADEARGGFLAIETPRAGELCEGLRARGIHTDHRGALLRLGPAPYTGGTELLRAMDTLRALL